MSSEVFFLPPLHPQEVTEKHPGLSSHFQHLQGLGEHVSGCLGPDAFPAAYGEAFPWKKRGAPTAIQPFAPAPPNLPWDGVGLGRDGDGGMMPGKSWSRVSAGGVGLVGGGMSYSGEFGLWV